MFVHITEGHKTHKANTDRTKRRIDKGTIVIGDLHHPLSATDRLSRWKIRGM